MDLFGPWLGHEIPRGFRHFPPKLTLTSNHWHGPSQIHSNKNLSLYAYCIHLQTISSFGANEIRQFPCDSPASLPMSTYVRMMKSNILVASTLSFDGKNSDVHQKNQSHVLVTSLISPRIIRIWNYQSIQIYQMYGILPALEATTSTPDAMAANARKRHGGRAVISTLLWLAEVVHHITTEMDGMHQQTRRNHGDPTKFRRDEHDAPNKLMKGHVFCGSRPSQGLKHQKWGVVNHKWWMCR